MRRPSSALLLLSLARCAATEELLVDAGVQDAGATPDAAAADAAPSDGGGCDPGPPVPGTVVVAQGRLQGEPVSPRVTRYLGIPFAAPPLGALRFRAPEPPSCYGRVRTATTFAPRCPQLEGDTPVGAEDCLALNVWAPATAATARPVMLFIHGGGNSAGSAGPRSMGDLLYDGRPLVEQHDVVVVTVQYRLAALGWLAHPDLEGESGASGNYGTRDQLAALAWVRDNISAFGGDPSRVTIFGESAGAVNVCVLLASPLAAGLFHRAIMQSGACVVPAAARLESDVRELLTRSGCAGAPEGEIPCLRGKSAAEILTAYPPVIDVAGRTAAWQPRVDGVVLRAAPGEELAAGRHNHVPFIVGSNADETALAVPPIADEAAYQALVTSTFGPLAPQVLAVYPAAAYPTPRLAYVALTSDLKFVCTARRTARAAAMGQSEPVHRYVFAQGLEGAPRLRPFGAYHGVELAFVFDVLDLGAYPATPAELALADQLGDYWTGLAASGTPGGAGRPEWSRYAPPEDNVLVFTSSSTTQRRGVRPAQCDFWDQLAEP